jgi:hypothetical protein
MWHTIFLALWLCGFALKLKFSVHLENLYTVANHKLPQPRSTKNKITWIGLIIGKKTTPYHLQHFQPTQEAEFRFATII